MMMKRLAAGVSLLFFATGLLRAQDQTAFKLLPERPVPGSTVSITYDPASTVLAGQDSIKGVVYEYNNFAWEAKDLDLHQQGKTYSTQLALPANCGIIFLKFWKGDVVDNNKDFSYFYMMQDTAKGIAAVGGYAGYGLFRGPSYGAGVDGYFKNFNISDTAFYYWLSQELSYHKEGRLALSDLYCISNFRYQRDTASPRISAALNFLLHDSAITELHYEKTIRVYKEIGKTQIADSLTKVELQKYPAGNLARKMAYRNLNDKNMDTTLARNIKFLQDFPPAKFPAHGVIPFLEPDNDKVYQTIILLNSIKGNFKPVYQYAPSASFITLIAMFYKTVEIPYYLKKTMTAKEAGPIADTLQYYMRQYQNKPDARVGIYSPDEWNAKVYLPDMTRNAEVYVDLLFHLDRYKDAMVIAEEAQQVKAYKDAELNDLYIRLLQKTKQEEKINSSVIASITANAATPWILERAKADYVKAHGSDAGYDAYINNLKGNKGEAEMIAGLKAEMQNEPLADFAMKDMNGKTVTLSSLKGKVVVLDFWATWCAPCKASFPGMNMAREKYAKDDEVAFYFVDTQEMQADYRSQVKKYLEEKKFPFNVLFDNGDATKHKMSEVYDMYGKQFHLSGIPQKLIIGADGKLKFLAVGYNGSPSALADEISAMIELAKKAN